MATVVTARSQRALQVPAAFPCFTSAGMLCGEVGHGSLASQAVKASDVAALRRFSLLCLSDEAEGFEELVEVDVAILIEIDAANQVIDAIVCEFNVHVGTEQLPGLVEFIKRDETWGGGTRGHHRHGCQSAPARHGRRDPCSALTSSHPCCLLTLKEGKKSLIIYTSRAATKPPSTENSG